MTGFRRRRKSVSQKKTEESRKRVIEKRRQLKRNKVTYSTGFVFTNPPVSLESVKIGRFIFQPVDPLHHNHGGIPDAFRRKSDYGNYAPFIPKLFAELTTCEHDWKDVMIDDEPFLQLDPDERSNLITKFSSDVILLLRLRGLTNFITPFDIIGSTFQDLKNKTKSVALMVRSAQSMIDFLPNPNPTPKILDGEDFKWIEKHCSTINRLNRDGRMNFIHDVYDTLNFPNMSVQLMTIWSCIESIILSEPQRTSKSIKVRCAMILGGEEEEQKSRFKLVGELYDFRCKVIHGNKNFDMQSIIEELNNSKENPDYGGNLRKLFQSYNLMTSLLIKVIERGEFWSRDELREIQHSSPFN